MSKTTSSLLVGAAVGALSMLGGMRLLATPEAPEPAAAPSPDSEAQIMERLQADLAAGLARWYAGDPSGYADLYADELSYFDPGTPVSLDGLGALRAYYEPLEGRIQLDRFETSEHRLQLFGDVAVLTFLLSEYPEGESPSVVWKVTHVYERSGEDWRVVHGHFSTDYEL